MLQALYKDKTEKQLRSALKLHSAFLIVSIILPILFMVISYNSSGRFYSKNLAIFFVIIAWSSLNVNYLKGVLKK